MPKKVLPKTPDSLFDPIEYDESSRSRTPTPQRQVRHSRSPTPKISPLRNPPRNQNLPWYQKFLISNITFYCFLVLTFLLFLTISRGFLPLSYCESPNDVDCKPCPENAKCTGGIIECNEGAHQIKDLCIIPGSLSDTAVNLTSKIEELIASKAVSNIDELMNLTVFKGISRKQIQIAIHLSDKYIMHGNGSFDVKWNDHNINLMLYIVFGLCFLIFLLSVFFRAKV